MFIKCASIVLYIISLIFLVFFSFEYSIENWTRGNNQGFIFLTMLIIVLILLIVTACFNLSNTIKTWHEIKSYNKELDQIID